MRGVEAVDLGQGGGRGWPATEHGGFISALDLPNDATFMTLDQLDRLIAYHDALCTRYDEALCAAERAARPNRRGGA